MNFSQLHERLRLEMLRRIERGALTSALLALQTGFTASHISNFLNRKRMLSFKALDRVLDAQHLTVADLSVETDPSSRGVARASAAPQHRSVPLVTESTAIHVARIPSSLILDVVKVRSGLLEGLREKCSARRREWDRVVAVQLTAEQARGMQPVLRPNTVALIDRHYNSPRVHAGDPRYLYAVGLGNQLRFRYAALLGRQLVLDGHKRSHFPELVALGPGQAAADFLVGRVFLTMTEL